MSSTALIPAAYRIAFIWVDGLMSLVGAYIHFFSWKGAFREHFPQLAHIQNLDSLDALMYPIGGAMSFQALVQLVLLPGATDSLHTWNVVQAGLVINDVVIIYSCILILRGQGKRTVGESVGSGAFTGILATGVRTVARVLFLAGVGV